MLHYKIDQVMFWNIFNQICNLEQRTNLSEFLEVNNFKHKDFEYVSQFLNSINHPLDLRDAFLYPLHQENLSVTFKMSEWVSLQALFPHLSQFENLPYFNKISESLSQIESDNSHLDIFEYLKEKPEQSNLTRLKPIGLENDENKINFLEEAIVDKNLLEVKLNSDEIINVFPIQLVFIGGELELIYQRPGYDFLESIDLVNLEVEKDLDQEYNSKFSETDIESFINHLREIEEKSIRLVLKINSLANFELKCKGESFNKSCMFSNPEGQKIWAATIEPSQEIFEWLLKLQDDIQILSPNEFKKEFLEYCEKKVAKIA